MDDRSYSDAAHLFADVVEKLPQMHRPLYLAMVAQELEGMMKAADAIFAQGMSLAALGGVSSRWFPGLRCGLMPSEGLASWRSL